MADILADVIRVSKNTRAEFTGVALKIKQIAFCYNTDNPDLGMEIVLRDVDTLDLGSNYESTGADSTKYYFFNVSEVPVDSPVTIVDSTSGIQGLLDSGKSIFFLSETITLTGSITTDLDTVRFLGSRDAKVQLNALDWNFTGVSTNLLEITGVATITGANSIDVNGGTEPVFETLVVTDGATIDTSIFVENIKTDAASATLKNITLNETISYQNTDMKVFLTDSTDTDKTTDWLADWKRPRDFTKKSYKLGYVDPDGISVSFDDPTRTHSITHTSGYVELWSDGKYWKIPNGDSKLSYQVPLLNQLNYLQYDNTGQLVGSDSIDWDNVKTRALADIVGYDKDVPERTLTISRHGYADANHIENYASYRSKGLQPTDDKVTMDGTVGGTQTGHTAGSYLSSRDYQFDITAVAATSKVWPIYYYDGADDSGNYRIKRHLSLPSTAVPFIRETDIGGASSNLIYNLYNPGTDTFSVAVAGASDFVIGHIAVGDGQVPIVALTPQGTYNTVGEARAAIDTEVENLTISRELFHDIGIIASFICKGDTGVFQDADGNGNAFVIPRLGVTGGTAGGGGATSFNGLTDTQPNKVGADTNLVQVDESNDDLIYTPLYTTPATLTLVNGWEEADSGLAPKYIKTITNTVMISGAIAGGTTTNGTLIGTLPVGFRPVKELRFLGVRDAITSTPVVFYVNTSGEIRIHNGDDGYSSLNGIIFNTDF